jgi:hypothetical protein
MPATKTLFQRISDDAVRAKTDKVWHVTNIAASIVAFLTAFSVYAADYPLRREIPSPDKRCVLIVTQPEPAISPTLIIRDQFDLLLFTSATSPIATIDEFDSDTVRWSPDSQAVAIAGGDPRFKLTHLLVRRGSAFVYIPLPDASDGNDNPWIIPVKWVSGRRLVLDITGPHAGHPDWSYNGRATIRVSTQPLKCEKLYQHFTLRKHDQ